MSSKSSYGSQYAGVSNLPIVGAIGSVINLNVNTTVSGIASAATNTQTGAIIPAGIWVATVNFDISSQGGVFNLINIIGGCGVFTSNTSLTVATDAGVSQYQPSLSFVVVSDGLSPITVDTSCAVSAGTWSLLDTSLASIVRVA
jgi:hypothetical protein